MRIKQIELVGFKSFCDKTTLRFIDNMTAIVGPNGCGKSNVVDAMRWVMGSKSPKQLRGATMEDVIFIGTESRGPMGMAEVTFTLDLRDGVAPVQYSEYSEVAVTRRLHRDGTSEYFIQKVPVRLTDVRELFLGTGVGHYAYAIIEQGRVGEMVSSRPESRRQFIEEAAGITLYKEKKHKAELKMAATRQNLLRITDIVSELQTSMRRLWRAAKKAERYEDCRDEVADLEKWQISQQLLGNLTRAGMVRAELEGLTTAVTGLDTRTTEREGTLAAGRLELRDMEVKLSDRNAEMASLDNKVRLVEAQIEHMQREISDLGRRRELDAAESRRLADTITRNEEALVNTGKALESIGVEFEQKQELCVVQETALGEARQAQAEVDARVDELRDLSSRTDTRIASLQSDQRSDSYRLEESTRRLDQVEQDQRGYRAEADGLGPDIAAMENRVTQERAQNEERQVRGQALTERLILLKDQVARLEVELDTARGQLHRNRSRLASLEEIQRRYEGFQQGTRAIMENMGDVTKDKEIHGLLADVVEAPVEYEAAVEAVLGERLGAILVADSGVSLDAVEYLKKGNRGRSSFLPVEPLRASESGSESPLGMGDTEITDPRVRGMILDLVKVDGEFKEVAGKLLQNVLVVEDLEHALQVWRTQKEPRTVVTLDGEVVDPFGLVTGGSVDVQGASVLGQKREIRELQELCEELQSQHDDLHERLVTSKQEGVAFGTEEEDLRRTIHESDMTLLGLSKDTDAARSRLEGCQGRLQVAEQEADNLRETIRSLETHRAECSTELDQLVDKQTVSREQLDLGLQAAGADRQRVDSLAGEVGDLKVNVARAAEQRNTSQREITRLESDLETDRQRLVTLTESATLNTERVETLVVEVDEANEKRLEISSQAMDLGEKLAEESEVCERRRGELDELEASLKQHRDDRRELSTERENANLVVSELAKDWEYLADRLAERHHSTTQEVLFDFHLRPIFDEELEVRLTKQSKVLESLRNTYHPGARQEYEELSERHGFLSEQKQDLEDALERLDKAIQKINRTSRARFRTAFEGINEQFKVVYPRLFKGGTARLELTQSNDILNAGVEIIARPPGKKLQSVDLLSGGEKALTAVALLFAIFRYKPSPFCLLDEVDAPLDDANVDRFNEIVREMADDTQFIIITHNKRTMALSESLYGVTMEQAGCSKVVQVNFREASDMVDDDGPGGPGGSGSSGGSDPASEPASEPEATHGDAEGVAEGVDSSGTGDGDEPSTDSAPPARSETPGSATG